jgi:hypothetical protein
MTLNANDVRDEYTAAAGQTVFNYTFKIYESTDLDIYVTPAGQECSESDLTTAYTVTGVGDENGGTITLTTPTTLNDLVTIVSSIPTSRTTDYQNNGDFRPDTVNDDFDKAYSLIKQIEDTANRSLQFPTCQQGVSSLTLPTPVAHNYVRWKSDLSGLENQTIGNSGAALGNTYIDYPSLRAETSADLNDGDYLWVEGFPDPWQVKTGTVTDSGWYLVFDDDSNRYAESTSEKAVVKIFGAPEDGVGYDREAAQAAIDFVLNGSDSDPKIIKFGPILNLDQGLVIRDTGGLRYEVEGGSNIASTKVICDYNGYGSGTTYGPCFEFGDKSSPSYQTAVALNGFLFTKGPNCTRPPLAISADSWAQSRINDITSGGWNNTVISLNTPQNVRGTNITTFGGGVSFEYKDSSAVTVTQSGTTLTADGAIFSSSDVGKTVGIWGIGTDYRRRAVITSFTDSQNVEVAKDVTDATARRLIFASPFASMTAGSPTLTADANCFTADHVGLVLWVKGAGDNSGLLRAEITAFVSSSQVTLSLNAETTTTTSEFCVAAMEIWSDEVNLSNGASDNRFYGVQIEDHNGVGLCVYDSDILHIDGKIHSEQTVSSDDYSLSTIWADRWAGSFYGDWDAQYLGEHRAWFGNQTSTLHINNLHSRSARDEVIAHIGPRATTFEGASIVFGNVTVTGSSSTSNIRGEMITDDNLTIPGYVLEGSFTRPEYDETRVFLGKSAFATNDGELAAESISFDNLGNNLDAYERATAFTPEIADAASGGNTATGVIQGVYERIGNLMFVSLRLANIDTTGMTGGNDLYIRNLPEPLRGGAANIVTGGARLDNVTFSGNVQVFADDADDYFLLYDCTSGSAASPLTVSALSSGTAAIRLSIVYLTQNI